MLHIASPRLARSHMLHALLQTASSFEQVSQKNINIVM
jgi:hypothetical protein